MKEREGFSGTAQLQSYPSSWINGMTVLPRVPKSIHRPDANAFPGPVSMQKVMWQGIGVYMKFTLRPAHEGVEATSA